MKWAPCAYGGKKPCCSVTFCPLVPAWATTIHKFQGFEAGKEEWDSVNNLIVDVGDVRAEGNNPGLLYVATSRAKTIGSISPSNPHPTDSAIYFHGEMSERRVQHCKTFDAVDKSETICNREEWVQFLLNKAEETRREIYTDKRLNTIRNGTMERALNFSYQSERELDLDITNMLLKPNEIWKQERRKYVVDQSFFN